MKGILFGSYHSYDDFNLLLVSKEVGSPNVKVKEIDIPGADGVLDLTDFFGSAKYENVTHKFQFQTIVPQNFLSTFSAIKNAIHGKKQRIILDDDPAFYYVGRCFVSAFTSEKNIGTVSVECVCEPWKYKLNETKFVSNLSGNNLFAIRTPILQFQGTTHEITDRKIKIKTIYSTDWAYGLFEVFPIKFVVDNTITFSCTVNPSTGATPFVAIGFYKGDGRTTIKQVVSRNTSGSLSLTAKKSDADEYDYIGLWFYTSRAVAVPAGTYTDYDNIQIEFGNRSTDFEPYNYTERQNTITIQNSRKKVIPEISASKAMTISKDGYSASLQANRTYQFPEFEFSEGNNEFSVTSTGGFISFTYQEGSM